MTATPRDRDVSAFTEHTGYNVGRQEEWATISRQEGVAAGLLKRGVKTVRFLTKNEEDARLLDFEEVAMSECAAMHQTIKRTLVSCGVALTPLMLVQVPNGGAAILRARKFLVEELKFPESAVRVHEAAEPDPNLLALAQDPTVEVIVFKVALAMGFDAPRAFTLAALRGSRDAEFGIQVVGRLMRVHRALQQRAGLPPVLSFGYVYLANSETQEGLTSATQSINRITSHTASEMPETVVTYTVDSAFVQSVQNGRPLSLFPPARPADAEGDGFGESDNEGSTDDGFGLGGLEGMSAPTVQTSLLLLDAEGQPLVPAGVPADQLVRGAGRASALARSFELESPPLFRYRLRDIAPASLVTEVLPDRPADLETRLVSFVDFSSVLADKGRPRTMVTRRVSELFENPEPEDESVWARMSTADIAMRARQIAFEFGEVDRRQFLEALKQRFRDALETGGYDMPETEEALTQQLELVLVRNPALVRQAVKRCRAGQITWGSELLPKEIVSDIPLEPAKLNIYGVMPQMATDEAALAIVLDTSPDVLWWHRNPRRSPHRIRSGCTAGRRESGSTPTSWWLSAVAPKETASRCWSSKVRISSSMTRPKPRQSTRPTAGLSWWATPPRVEKKELRLFRLVNEQLVDDGLFEISRLRYE